MEAGAQDPRNFSRSSFKPNLNLRSRPADIRCMRDAIKIIPGRARRKSRWLAAYALAFIIVTGGVIAALSGGHNGFPLAVTAFAFFVSVMPYSALLTTSFARDLQISLRKRPLLVFLVPLAFFLTYLMYAVGTESFEWSAALRLALFVLIPSGLSYAGHVRGRKISWLDAAAIAAVWMPFDLGWLASIWSWPAGEGAYVINTAMAVVLAAVLFIGLRRFDHVSLRCSLNGRELRSSILCLVGFLLLAIPFGFATDFISWNAKPIDLKTAIGTPLGILFFIAIPEELLFRGLVQNLFEKILPSKFKALVLASLFFGLTHLNNEPQMDWRYITLATTAGFFYGTAYQKSRSLIAPALVHMLVDTLWVLLFLKI